MYEIIIKTPKRECLVDITSQVLEACAGNYWHDGILNVFCAHTTCGLTINENTDPDVLSDLMNHMNKLVPNLDSFCHYEGNSDGHIKASMTGHNLTLFVECGQILLGKWQAIYLAEFDGPRERKIWLKFIRA